MNPEQLLEQLEPLRAPSTIGFFPLAPGWWLVVALVRKRVQILSLMGCPSDEWLLAS